MKIYLHLSRTTDLLRDICVSALKEAGVLLVTNFDDISDADFSARELKRLKMSGQNLLDKMDGFVIEATAPDPEVGYLLAHAMSQKKPTLYLIEKGTKLGKHIQRLPENISIKEYVGDSLRTEILEFLRHIEQGWVELAANIKFTLRITPQIERYMQWKAKKKKISKADFLRAELVDKIIAEDEEYQDHLKKI